MLVGGFCTVNEFYNYGWFCNIWRSDWPRYVSFMQLAVFYIFLVHLGSQVLHHGAAARERRLTVTLFIVTILSLALWLPYIVNIFVNYSTDYATIPGFRRAAIALFKSRCRQQRQIQVFPLREV
ncbi:hypothetical protein pdam_00025979 [Pocillopora damicornis]|uniref:G-protein coupled receptors family 1 profile domain-containing protein n=1 Tax=Pocillopora damicornis TaxID=46731 RepID=A0A3M6V1P2_POCDA|nr:hypothetical protein pdam_00025979 [Pocillopora damicornis]